MEALMNTPAFPSTYESKMYCVHEHPFAYATLTDFGPGQGLIQIHSDWGTYSNFWSSIGKDRKIAEFVIGLSPSYLETKLTWQMNYMGCKKEAYARLTKFMAQCWPRLKELIEKDVAENIPARPPQGQPTDAPLNQASS
jgi:hypothetical protein